MQDIIVQYKHSYSKRRTGVSNKHIKAQFTKEEDHHVKQKKEDITNQMILTEFSIKFQLFYLGETNNNKNTNT